MTNLTGVRVLVVDDDRFMRSTVTRMLRLLGEPIIQEAADGQSGLLLVASFKPDIILCDIGMAPMNGLEFVRHLRVHPDVKLRDVPVIILTANAQKETVKNARDLGISGYLVKPILPAQLSAQLNSISRPQRTVASGLREAAAERVRAVAHNARVLIVDNDAPEIDRMRAILAGAGFLAIEHTTAANEIADICRRFDPHVLLLEQRIQGAGGLQVTETINAELSGTKPAIILIAAKADGDIRSDAYHRGVHDIVTKPFNHLELVTRTANAAEAEYLKRQSRAAPSLVMDSPLKGSSFAEAMHELRTPLNAICGYSDAMKLGIFGPIGEPKYTEYAGLIHQAGLHLQKIVDEVLDISRAESGEQELEIESVDIGELIGGAGDLLRAQAEAAGVQLNVKIDPTLTAIRTDATKIRQIVLNLGSNAIKYTPRGGRVTIEAKSDKAGGALILVVRDTGIGIAAEDLAQALRPFGRVNHDGKVASVQGTGLGLPLTLKYVEMLGGTLELSSEPGEGTIITIRLPPEPALQAA